MHMAIQAQPEASRGILGQIRGALGLFGETNKAGGVGEPFESVPQDEYESSLTELEVSELVRSWKKSYSEYYTPIDETQQLSYDYWIGRQRIGENGQVQATDKNTNDVVDNVLFEAIETFLPIATRANPDPLVQADPSDLGQRLAKDIKNALVKWADDVKFRRKLARMTRHWILYRLGALKVYWDPISKSIKVDVINPRRMIFDKDGSIDEGGHFKGEYVGEKKKATAKVLAQMFPKKKDLIKLKCNDKWATKLEYFEWWYKGTDLLYTIEDSVLGKFKNPNWNYDIPATEAVPAIEENPETGEAAKAEVVAQPGTPGVNHLETPMAPYVFLGVFSTGLHPHDDTSLILQNISIQDLINRRWRQIDRNVDGMNNGMVVSGQAFTEEQAAQAASALRRGTAIRVPNGNVNEAVARFAATALPSDVPENLQDARSELRGIFGTSGSSPQGTQQEDTVRGKILINQQDSSRIGGGVTEQIEQVADSVYNWVVQLMYVYYDEEHYLIASGQTGGMELIAIKNDAFPLLKTLDVTVKEGSLVPKDPLTKRNEAIDLWSEGAIDPLSFYKALDFPDPNQSTQQLILWQLFQKGLIPPQAYLPSFQIEAQGQVGQPTGVGGPAVNPPPNGGIQNQSPKPESNEAVASQSNQLIQSIPAS